MHSRVQSFKQGMVMLEHTSLLQACRMGLKVPVMDAGTYVCGEAHAPCLEHHLS